MTTAYEVPLFEALPGDAAALRQHAHRYDEIAKAIADVAAQLDVLGDENATIGDAADALRERVRDASTRLDDVEPRYVSAAIGVSEFAVALADSQTRANQAIAERNEIVDALIQLYGESHEQFEAIRRAGYEGTIPQELVDSHHATLRRISEREDRLYEVWMAYLDADQRRHDAATAAASRIVAGALGSTDNFFDHLAAWWEQTTELFEALAQWIGTVLFEALVILMAIELILLLLVFAVVLVAVLGVVLVAGGPGALGMVIASFAEDWQGNLEQLIAVVLTTVAPLSVFLRIVLGIEALTLTPQMRPVMPFWGVPTDRTDPEGGEYGNYEYALLQNGAVDDKGGPDATYVEIVRVSTDENGDPIWRVTLPSTQNWQLGLDWFDQGAANDLGSNLALVLTPAQQAQYERMVLAAMEQAGIAPTDEVMLVGFSQGGILAGKLASDPSVPFNIQAIVTAGSPIDHFDIPSDVSVLSLRHENDVVPLLDGIPSPPDTASRVTIVAPVPEGLADHGAVSYAITASAIADDPQAIADPELRAVVSDQQRFFSDEETSYYYMGQES